MLRVLQGLVLLSTLMAAGVAAAHDIPEPLNQIQMTLSAETWAKTSLARVIVTVDAVLNQSNLANMHQNISGKLKKISNDAPWHITTFNRQKDKSDLERIYVVAEARLPEAALLQVRKAVDSLSKEGEKFRISAIEFTPSLSDMEVARQDVRHQIYTQAKSELARLNALYPDQHYFLHLVNFNPEIPTPIPMERTMTMAAVSTARAERAPSVTVSDNVQMTAQVLFAAKTPSKATAKQTP